MLVLEFRISDILKLPSKLVTMVSTTVVLRVNLRCQQTRHTYILSVSLLQRVVTLDHRNVEITGQRVYYLCLTCVCMGLCLLSG